MHDVYFFLGEALTRAVVPFLLVAVVASAGCFLGVPPFVRAVVREFSELSLISSLELDRTSPSICNGDSKKKAPLVGTEASRTNPSNDETLPGRI